MVGQTKDLAVIPVLLSLLAYFCLAYFTSRAHTTQLFILVGLLFGLYYWLLSFPLSFKQGVCLAIVLRLIFIVAYPRLSDDYFRFIWDGTLVAHGENPFLHLPSYFVNQEMLTQWKLSPLIYSRLNSPNYFSVYPPVCQFIFGVAYFLGGSSILLNCVVMRTVILLAEVGTLFILKHLLRHLNLPINRIWWYAFNPLIVIELTGNLHFEALLIFFLLAGIYLLVKGREILSGVLFALAVGVKLLPLMLMPLLLGYLGLRRFFKYGAVTAFVLILLFLPFISEAFIKNIFTSLDLYFQKFEFNASTYYLMRWIGFRVSGYNEIARLGPLLSIVTVLGICIFGFYQKKGDIRGLLNAILLAFMLYLGMATIIHPWYITTLVALSCLTNWRFPVVWSGMVFLSYTAYGNALYKENYGLLFIEYVVVFGVLILEVYQLKQKDRQVALP